jgi:histidyl-tRNA synthetase
MLNHISGFKELSPKDQIAFDNLIAKITDKFQSYGFIPLETSFVEKRETLLSKGNDNEIYGISRLLDNDSKEKELGLRFDLTVPLARYVQNNHGIIVFPYKRYHIAPVFRGERPQKGRHRQFYQCDIDILNKNILAKEYDAEILSLIFDIFEMLKIGTYQIKLNNRKILAGIIKYFNIEDESQASEVLKTIDKREKISQEEFKLELQKNGVNEICQLIKLLDISSIEELKNAKVNQIFDEGVKELENAINLACGFFNEIKERIVISTSLARGLNYYTGCIYEVILTDARDLGSVCGGGRYDKLVSISKKEFAEGVGVSFGITRLFSYLVENNLLDASKNTIAEVLITVQDKKHLSFYSKISQILRQKGIKTELYLQSEDLSSQLKYANKKGFTYAIIANSQEIENNVVIVKNLLASTQEIVACKNLQEFIRITDSQF